MSFNDFERKHTEGFYLPDDIVVLYKLQEGQCYYCEAPLGNIGGKDAYHLDHLMAISKGGTNWPGNLALACSLCNRRKHSHDTQRLWAKLRAEKGSCWVKGKVQRNRTNTAAKAKLTKKRTQERARAFSCLTTELRAALDRALTEKYYLTPTDIDVHVEQLACYLEITFNGSFIGLPAPTPKALGEWGANDFDMLASMLVNLEHLAGYLKRSPSKTA